MRRNERGFSLIELIIVVLVIGVIAAIAVPNLLSSRRAANEASAIQVARKISSAQTTYYTTLGSQNYATAAQLYGAQLINQRTAAAANVNVGGNPARNTPSDGYNFRIQVTAGPDIATIETARPPFGASHNPELTDTASWKTDC